MISIRYSSPLDNQVPRFDECETLGKVLLSLLFEEYCHKGASLQADIADALLWDLNNDDDFKDKVDELPARKAQDDILVSMNSLAQMLLILGAGPLQELEIRSDFHIAGVPGTFRKRTLARNFLNDVVNDEFPNVKIPLLKSIQSMQEMSPTGVITDKIVISFLMAYYSSFSNRFQCVYYPTPYEELSSRTSVLFDFSSFVSNLISTAHLTILNPTSSWIGMLMQSPFPALLESFTVKTGRQSEIKTSMLKESESIDSSSPLDDVGNDAVDMSSITTSYLEDLLFPYVNYNDFLQVSISKDLALMVCDAITRQWNDSGEIIPASNHHMVTVMMENSHMSESTRKAWSKYCREAERKHAVLMSASCRSRQNQTAGKKRSQAIDSLKSVIITCDSSLRMSSMKVLDGAMNIGGNLLSLRSLFGVTAWMKFQDLMSSNNHDNQKNMEPCHEITIGFDDVFDSFEHLSDLLEYENHLNRMFDSTADRHADKSQELDDKIVCHMLESRSINDFLLDKQSYDRIASQISSMEIPEVTIEHVLHCDIEEENQDEPIGLTEGEQDVIVNCPVSEKASYVLAASNIISHRMGMTLDTSPNDAIMRASLSMSVAGFMLGDNPIWQACTPIVNFLSTVISDLFHTRDIMAPLLANQDGSSLHASVSNAAGHWDDYMIPTMSGSRAEPRHATPDIVLGTNGYNRMNINQQESSKRSHSNAQSKSLPPCCVDLTMESLNHDEWADIIGRDEIIDDLEVILNRKDKSNPLLVAPAGRGKTAIVEALAHRIAHKKSFLLDGYKIVSLDLGGMSSSSSSFMAAIATIRNFITKAAKEKTIVFIDEIHLIATMMNGEIADMLKPVLSRPGLHVIGATTEREYNYSIAKDKALDRRFSLVRIPALDDKSIELITAARMQRYGTYHHIGYDESLAPVACSLARRYMTNAESPDREIDIIDTAFSLASRNEESIVGHDMDFTERFSKELTEENLCDAVRMLSSNNNIMTRRQSIESLRSQGRESESDRIARLFPNVAGQKKALEKIATQLSLSSLEICDKHQPRNVFLFVGKSSVGKTYTACQMARPLGLNEDSVLSISMGEYQDRISTSRLLGASPQYVGYKEGGVLTNFIKSHPNGLVILDEIDKCHPAILKILLGAFDDGILTAGNGENVDCSSITFVCTTNAGIDDVTTASSRPIGFIESNKRSSHDMNEKKAMEALRKEFGNPFMNRIDCVVLFSDLTEQDIVDACLISYMDFAKRINQSYNVDIMDEKHQSKARIVIKRVIKSLDDNDKNPRVAWRKAKAQLMHMILEKI